MIVEEVKKFVEEECRKPTSKYGLGAFENHFKQMHACAVVLAKEKGADLEIVEIATWLHDIGSIVYGRENHHITGAEIAETKLKELNYPADKIERVKKCILKHRGSVGAKAESKEEETIIEADAMSNFDNIAGIFRGAYITEGLNEAAAKKSALDKLERKWQQLGEDAKKIVLPKYEAVMLLLGEKR
jgi:uncharacterized protein